MISMGKDFVTFYLQEKFLNKLRWFVHLGLHRTRTVLRILIGTVLYNTRQVLVPPIAAPSISTIKRNLGR